MNINEFIRERKKEWQRLERIAAKFRPGRSADLTRDELWDLSRLYFAAISDLSLLKSSQLGQAPDDDVVAYVNGLVIRVHRIVYSQPSGSRWASIVKFLSTEFPLAVARNLLYIGSSAGVMILSALAGFVIGVQEPNFVELLVPDSIISTVEGGDVWFKGLYAVAPMASSHLMTHNISVTFLTFAAGITFGVGTIYLLGLNGLLLGTIAGLCFRHQLSLQLWSFVLPHGSLELSAIVLSGAAGLILGHALVDPGPYRRLEFLSVRSRDAVALALGCVPLLAIAGVIEAFFSPSPLPPWLKLGTAGVLFLLLVTLLGLAAARGKEKLAKEVSVGPG
ncbi:MAG: stage II sporulation protein M [Desulfomonile tiedjei]|nr:stage II sporulation protein M [Desulfomonile tiedjei]